MQPAPLLSRAPTLVDLNEILAELRESLAVFAGQYEVTLSITAEPLLLRLNRAHFRQLLEILIRHAVRHTVSESEIQIRGSCREGRIRLLLITPRPLPFQHELEEVHGDFCASRNRRWPLCGEAGVHLAIAVMLARWNAVEIAGLPASIASGGFLLRMPGPADSGHL